MASEHVRSSRKRPLEEETETADAGATLDDTTENEALDRSCESLTPGAQTATFWAWLQAGGAQVEGVALSGGGCGGCRGLFAARHFLPGDTVCELPRKLLFTPRDAEASKLGKAAAVVGASSDMTTWMCMAAGRLDRSDPWHAYFKALPNMQPGPTGWSMAFLRREFAGTGLPMAVRSVRQAVEEELNDILPRLPVEYRKNLCLASILWARGIFLSRCFPAALSDSTEAVVKPGESEPFRALSSSSEQCCMVPLLDMANHGPGRRVQWEVRSCGGGGAVALRTLEELSAGEEVLINYGCDRSNEHLLLSYGFAVHGNQHDVVSGLVLFCEQGDSAEAEERRLALARSGLPCVLAPPSALLVGPFEVGGPPWQAALPPRLLQALELLADAEAVQALLAALVQRREALMWSEQADEAASVAGMEGLQGSLSAYRIGQRRVLDRTLAETREISCT